MKPGRVPVLLAALLAVASLHAADERLPGRDDYAYGFRLTTQGAAEFYALDMPLAFYRSVADSELRDAGVFNADGQPVPRQFEHRPPVETSIESTLVLGLVPLFGQQDNQPEQLRLLLRSADGTTLEYAAPDSGIAQDPATGKPLTGYIADSRTIAQDQQNNPAALAFDWPAAAEGFIGKVTIQDSEDLQSWRDLAGGTLADLQYEDTRVAQNRVGLARRPGNYLRISWQNMPDGWSLTGMHAIYTSTAVAARRDSISLDAVKAGDASREHIFDVGGYPPVDRMNLLLPDENIVLRASVFYRHDGEQRWLPAYSGLFYNIRRDGNAVQSAPASIPVLRARHWKVVINSGATTSPPRLQLGWYPDQLVFLAQGNAPFELVAGRARDRLEHYPQQRVLGDSSIFHMLRQSGQAGAASIGPRVEITGPAGLQVGAASPWKIALLWLGLSAAVTLVGWLVWSLMRDMRKAADDR